MYSGASHKLYSGVSLQGTSCTVEPLYRGQVVESCRVEPLYRGQVVEWSLSTRDKLKCGASLQGTSCTVEPLYKGQVRDIRMGPYPMYSREVFLFSEKSL